MNEELQNEYVDVNVHDNYPSSDEHITVPPMQVIPLKKICMTIGELPTSYLETMTYYEMLLWFIAYLRDNIIPTVNNNGEALQEVQTIVMSLQNYINDYKDSIDQDVEDLEAYMNDYFENLDVQEEINNKLDEMVEDGTLQNLIASYLQTQIIYNTHAEMIADYENLVDGVRVQTLGYYSINDGGGAFYLITNTSSLDDYQEELTTGLYAKKIFNDTVSVKQFGAYGDNTHDDTNAFSTAIQYFNIITIPDGQYKITNSIPITSETQIIGESMANTILNATTDNYVFTYITEVKPNRWDIKSNIIMKNFKANAKNFFKVNDENVADASWEYQASILHMIIDRIWIIGTYSEATDSNKDSNVVATENELIGYGIGLDLNNVFDSTISNSNIQGFGIGIYLKGCDINKIDQNRLVINGCHIYTKAISTYGSQTMILNNDILANKRYGGIRINGTTGDTIEDNYFETYTNASCYIYGVNENGLSILNNRFTNPAINNITAIYLSPYRTDRIINNRTTDRNYNMYVELDYSHNVSCRYPLDHRSYTVLYFYQNDTDLLLKNKAYVMTENYNPLVVSPYNVYYPNSRVYGTAILVDTPFLLDSTLNTYYFNNASGTVYIRILNALEYYGKPLKIRYYYKSSSSTTYYRVVSVDNAEIARGSLSGLVADSELHIIEDDLSAEAGVGNDIILTIPADTTVELFKVELF